MLVLEGDRDGGGGGGGDSYGGNGGGGSGGGGVSGGNRGGGGGGGGWWWIKYFHVTYTSHSYHALSIIYKVDSIIHHFNVLEGIDV